MRATAFQSLLSAIAAIAAAASTAPAAGRGEAPDAMSVEIVLADFSFSPKALTLKAGQPVTLRLVNRGSGGHDFTARAFFSAATMDASARSVLRKGRVSLKKGESHAITLTPARGQYEVHCSHFLHTSFGMKGTITVE